MSNKKSSRVHHWYPIGLQRHWADKEGNVSWIKPDGKIEKKKVHNEQIGKKLHGHTMLRGGVWETNFEKDFEVADRSVHDIIDQLRRSRPFGKNPIETIGYLRLLAKRDRSLHDVSRHCRLDERFQHVLLLWIYSILLRSPAKRSAFEKAPLIAGLQTDEDIGKANMFQSFASARELCESSVLANQYFVLLHSPYKKFLFGDGHLDWLTNSLTNIQIQGCSLLPITPTMCIYFFTSVNGGVRSGHRGGAKVGQFGVRGLERAAPI